MEHFQLNRINQRTPQVPQNFKKKKNKHTPALIRVWQLLKSHPHGDELYEAERRKKGSRKYVFWENKR